MSIYDPYFHIPTSAKGSSIESSGGEYAGLVSFVKGSDKQGQSDAGTHLVSRSKVESKAK